MQKDFDFILSIMDGFVRQTSVQNKLNLIKTCYITGWEIWFQIEFASYLNSHEFISEWYREEQYWLDKRKNKNQAKMAVDFLIRQKNTKKNQYIALELKQHYNTSSCFNNMLNDVIKVNTVQQSNDDFRSFWNIGIHPKEPKALIKKKLEKKLNERCLNMHNFITIKYIPNTDFAYTIF